MLGVTPHDSNLIWFINLIGFTIATFLFVAGGATGLLVVLGRRQSARCDEDSPLVGCKLDGVYWMILCSTTLLFLIPTSRNLRKTKLCCLSGVAKSYRLSQYENSAAKSSYILSDREPLERIWFGLRRWNLAIVIVNVAVLILFHLMKDKFPWYSNRDFQLDIINTFMKLLFWWLFEISRRRHMMAFLSSMTAEAETMSAASVAALLGGNSVSDSLGLAKKRFKSLCFTELKESDFINKTEDEGETNTLFEKAKDTKLGTCDAFISHSWSDDGAAKYEALRRWARNFRNDHGRSPKLWIDKAHYIIQAKSKRKLKKRNLDFQTDIAFQILVFFYFVASFRHVLTRTQFLKTYCAFPFF